MYRVTSSARVALPVNSSTYASTVPASRAAGERSVHTSTPGFTAAQYEKLALLYTIASVRAGTWIIPAFHSPIDADIRGGHDDPQNFDLDAFAASLDRILVALTPAAATVVKASAD